MALPYTVTDLNEVPDSAQELYEETDSGEYRLPVKGVKAEEEIGELERAYERVKKERNQYRKQAGRVSEEDLEELERLRKEAKKREEERAKEEGRWEDLRSQLQEEHKEELSGLEERLSSRDQVIEQLTVTSELRSAINEAGVKPEYQKAAEALLEKQGPKVKWVDGTPRGVFPDEVHGDRPIADYVSEWAESEEAEPYMPVSNGGGGGAEGRESSGPAIGSKKYNEMSQEEKVAYLEDKYGS